jgi:hypothetical protein
MTDIARFRNISPDARVLALAGRAVEADSVVDIPGKVTEENDDHYLIEAGNPAQTYAVPRATWAAETPRKSGKE